MSSEFDNLPKDGSSNPIPVGTREQFYDGADTPKVSPLNLTTAWQQLTIPEGAVECEAWTDDASIVWRYAADDGGDDGYALGVSGRKEIISCGGSTAQIWVYAESTCSLSFKFRMVKS